MTSCSHGLCNSSYQQRHRPDMKGVKFFAFPKPSKDLEKCKRWIEACNRVDFTVESVTKSTFICSKHFIGQKPSMLFPDPVFANETQPPSMRTRKRLRVLPNEETVGKKTNMQINSTDPLVYPVTITPMKPSEVPDANSLQQLSQVQGSQNSIFLVFQTDGDNIETPLVINQAVEPPPTISPEKLFSQLVGKQTPPGWTSYYEENTLFFFKIENELAVASVRLDSELKLSLKILGRRLQESHPISTCVSRRKVSSLEDVFSLLKAFEMWKICPGNSETLYTNVVLNQKTIAELGVVLQNHSLRSNSCELLIRSNKKTYMCKNCGLLKRRLTTAVKFCSKTTYGSSSKSKYMPLTETQRRINLRTAKLASLSRELTRLRKKLKKDFGTKASSLPKTWSLV